MFEHVDEQPQVAPNPGGPRVEVRIAAGPAKTLMSDDDRQRFSQYCGQIALEYRIRDRVDADHPEIVGEFATHPRIERWCNAAVTTS